MIVVIVNVHTMYEAPEPPPWLRHFLSMHIVYAFLCLFHFDFLYKDLAMWYIKYPENIGFRQGNIRYNWI